MSGTKDKILPSDVALAYDEARAAYIAAVQGYRNAYNGYDLTKKRINALSMRSPPGFKTC